MLLNDETRENVDFLFARAKELDMQKNCAFAVIHVSKLFDFQNTYATEVAESILDKDLDFIHEIISPRTKKTYVFTEKDIKERFFSENRKALLQEVKV